MAISVAGGDQQDQAAIQVILNYVEFGMSPEEAFKAPRFSTTHFISSFGQDRASLGSLSVPNTLPEEVQADLRARGHVVTASRGGVGGVALIAIDPKTKQATPWVRPPAKWNSLRLPRRTVLQVMLCTSTWFWRHSLTADKSFCNQLPVCS